MGWLSNLSRLAQLGLALLLILGVSFAIWYVAFRPAEKAQQAATAKTEAINANAQAGAATDTLRIVVDRQAGDVRIIKTTEENTREILAQPGATDVVSPDLHAAGIRALCLHDGARDVQCASVLQQPSGSERPQ